MFSATKRNGKVKPSEAVLDVLRRSRVDGNLLHLPPGQLAPSDYKAVKTVIAAIGGKWKGGKTQAHVFDGDPSEALASVLEDGHAIDKKQAMQFFGTPMTLAAQLVAMAELKRHQYVLEPSAGRGAIAAAIYALEPGCNLELVEIDPAHLDVLNGIGADKVMHGDFLTMELPHYDRVIANPPFNKGQDMTHVAHMINHTKPGGIVVSIMPISASECRGTASTIDFHHLLIQHEHQWFDVPDGAFKESGTGVKTCILKVRKAA